MADTSPRFAECLLGTMDSLGNGTAHFFAQVRKEAIKHGRDREFGIFHEKLHHSPEGEFLTIASKSAFSDACPVEDIRVGQCLTDNI